MKRICYRKRNSAKYRRKIVAITEKAEDKQCRTHVRKSFIYKVTRIQKPVKPEGRPQVNIRKFLDSESREEKLSFRVKGNFYMQHDRVFMRVDFCHTLVIEIYWKDKIFSPKPSASLLT